MVDRPFGEIISIDVMSLQERLIEMIRTEGPIPVSVYMAMCLHDPTHGYYATRSGLGRDFTTAPEISQVFGELLGLWAANEWIALGTPKPFKLVELGPGRGVMMADMLRAAQSVAGFRAAAVPTLIELSPDLRSQQLRHLDRFPIQHLDNLSDVGRGPSIILANEFLDCLPVRQFMSVGEGWREKQIGVDETGALIFGLSDVISTSEIEKNGVQPSGRSLEIAVGFEALIDQLSVRCQMGPLRALFIDYGSGVSSASDSLRAFRLGEQVDPLLSPGECDLTADVDFGRFSDLAKRAGLQVFGPVSQGEFLMALGLAERSQALARANPDRAAEVISSAERLIDPGGMGGRFNVICLTEPGAPAPAGFAANGST